MLRFQDPQRQSLGGVLCENRHGGLCHNWAFVHLRSDEMHGAAADLASCSDDALVRMEAPEGGQKRWVNVEMAVAPAFDKARRVEP